jgi:hypothetical protein
MRNGLLELPKETCAGLPLHRSWSSYQVHLETAKCFSVSLSLLQLSLLGRAPAGTWQQVKGVMRQAVEGFGATNEAAWSAAVD